MNSIEQSASCETAALPMPSWKFSLVLATLGRTTELSNFLSHLDKQSYRNFELIVVDQNLDDRLVPVLAPYYSRFAIKHLRSEKGLSRARNVGLRQVSGDIVAFPDDDCWYQSLTLQQVARILAEHSEWDGIVGQCTYSQAHDFLRSKIGLLDRFNIWGRTVSVSIFLKTSTVRAVGEFDEFLGSGSASGFGGAEEIDYVLRALETNCRIYYEPGLLVDHPDVFPVYDDDGIRKAYSYACGMGYTLKKHRYPLWYLGYYLLRPFGGAVLSLLKFGRPKARFYWALFRGRLSGWAGQGALRPSDGKTLLLD